MPDDANERIDGNIVVELSDETSNEMNRMSDFDSTAGNAGLGAEAGTSSAAQKVEQVREKASEYVERAGDRLQDWAERIDNFLKEKPVQSALIAAGVGLLLGMYLKRR